MVEEVEMQKIPKKFVFIILKNIVYSIIFTWILIWIAHKIQTGENGNFNGFLGDPSKVMSYSNLACYVGICIAGTLMGLESIFPMKGIICYFIFLISYPILGYILLPFIYKEPYSITYLWVVMCTPIFGIPKLIWLYFISPSKSSPIVLSKEEKREVRKIWKREEELKRSQQIAEWEERKKIRENRVRGLPDDYE